MAGLGHWTSGKVAMMCMLFSKNFRFDVFLLSFVYSLVDKELHVLVEDAVLTIECYPVPESSPESAAKGGDASLAGGENAHSATTANPE